MWKSVLFRVLCLCMCVQCVGLRRCSGIVNARGVGCVSGNPIIAHTPGNFIGLECIGVAVICWSVCLVPFVTLLILRDEWTRHIHSHPYRA